MSTARERVGEFLRQWKLGKKGALYSDTIYGVHKDRDAEEAYLTVQDVEAVLASRDKMLVMVEFLAERLEEYGGLASSDWINMAKADYRRQVLARAGQEGTQ